MYSDKRTINDILCTFIYSPLKKLLQPYFTHCNTLGLSFDSYGYLKDPELNLVDTFSNWADIRNEFDKGQGNEMKPDSKGFVKFCAIHSSSALCVNTFAPFKRDLATLNFLNHSKALEISFEKKLPTGISIPNLDLYIETEDEIIGVESKFTEYFTAKLPNKEGNLSKYQNRTELNYLPSGFDDLIDSYVKVEEKMYLDVAQLIKHSIGLINRSIKTKTNVKPTLVYIYWEPINKHSLVCLKHREEIARFNKEIMPFVNFTSISYPEFWEKYANDTSYSLHISKVRERYCFNI